jgi:hypothetical protein
MRLLCSHYNYQSQYNQHFGFTEEENSNLLKQVNLSHKEADIKKWYNGYVFGGTTVYNPWSIAYCLGNGGILKPYWANTSDNQVIKDMLAKSSTDFKKQLEVLLQDKAIEKLVDEDMVFGDLKNNHQAAWSLLIMSGYLKVASCKLLETGDTICNCAIPNWEIKMAYRKIIEEWLGNGSGAEWYQNFIIYLINGDITKFTENFGQVLSQTISVYDLVHNPEAFYHGFMLGLIAGLDQKQYEIKSNRESGLGRYDIAIIPKDIIKPAIILEIKSIVPPKMPKKKLELFLENTLTQEAQKALEQINHNKYTLELIQRGLKNIVKIGLAFSGKNFRVASESNRSK